MWYSAGLFAVPVRWVLVRDPEGRFKTQTLLCTDLEADPRKVVCWFVMRWQLEVSFQEGLGFETQRQWSDTAHHSGLARAVIRGQAEWYSLRYSNTLSLVHRHHSTSVSCGSGIFTVGARAGRAGPFDHGPPSGAGQGRSSLLTTCSYAGVSRTSVGSTHY